MSALIGALNQAVLLGAAENEFTFRLLMTEARLWTRFYLVLVIQKRVLVAKVTAQNAQGQFPPLVSLCFHERWSCGRLHAQSIQVAGLTGRGSGNLEGTLARISILPLAFGSLLCGLEIVIYRPDQRRPLQALL